MDLVVVGGATFSTVLRALFLGRGASSLTFSTESLRSRLLWEAILPMLAPDLLRFKDSPEKTIDLLGVPEPGVRGESPPKIVRDKDWPALKGVCGTPEADPKVRIG